MSTSENFWDDTVEEEAECERFLQTKKTKIIEEEETVVSAEYDDEEDDEEDEADEEDSEEQEEELDEAPETDAAADTEDSEGSDDSDPAAEADNDEAEAASTVKEKKMPKTKAKAGGKTKAEAIREVIDRRKRAGESLRPRDIIEELSDNGFEVNASQVSVTLRSMGVPPAPKGRVKGTKIKPEATPESKSRMALKRGVSEKPASKKADDFTVEVRSDDGPAAMVDMAFEFLQAVGGYTKAVSLLNSITRRDG